MSADPDVLLKQEKIQSYFKHRFLHHYAPQFARKLGRSGPVALVDGFSGRPFDDNGSPGSAPELVRLGLGQRNVSVTLMERSAKYLGELVTYVEEHAPPRDGVDWVTVVGGDTRANLGQIVSGYRDAHLLMYLDPCGYGVAYEDLVGLVNSRHQSWPSTEFMLNFGSGLVERIGGGYFAGTDDGERLTKACGGPWWIEVAEQHLLKDGTWANALPAIVRRFSAQLGQDARKHIVTVPIRSRPNVRPMFHMVCGTPSGVGVYALSDSFARAWDDWRTESERRAVVGTLFEGESVSLSIPGATRDIEHAKAEFRGRVLEWLARGESGVVGRSPELFRGFVGKLTSAEIGQELRAMAEEQRIQLVRRTEKKDKPSDYEIRAILP